MAPKLFLWSDAWLLAAIFWARRAEGEASLMYVVAYGDAINHAIFLPEELESGLVRLRDARLIEESGAEFLPIGEGERWYAEFLALNQNNWDSMQWAASKLQSEPYHGGLDSRNSLTYPGFTKATYDDAVTAYHAWFAEKLSQLDSK